MFGIFKRKAAPYLIGATVAENSLTYTEPTVNALLKLLHATSGSELSERDRLNFSYSIMLNAGSAIAELIIYHLRNVKFDHEEFRAGAKEYFDSFRDVYSQKMNLSIVYKFHESTASVDKELKGNGIFAQSGNFYGGGAKGSLYHMVVSHIFAISLASEVRDLAVARVRDGDDWGLILEAIEGIDRSYRWVEQSVDYGSMKRS